MRIIFFGTPPFSAYILEKLHTRFDVIAVVCPPDKEQGRGRKIITSAVKQKAENMRIKVYQPENLKDATFIKEIESIEAKFFVVVAFRMLPKEVWRIPKKGCINLHTSLLPDYRGAAPINRAIINGEKQTGITTFFINEKIDEGNIILQDKIALDERITAAYLHNMMMKKGTDLIIRTIDNIEKDTVKSTVQSKTSTDKIAPKLEKELLKIDWSKSAMAIHNLVRGLSPVLSDGNLLKDVAICPSAWFYLNVENNKKIRIKLLLSDFKVSSHSLPLGGIISDNKTHFKIVVKDGYISILELQMEGKKAMNIKSFLAGFQINNKLSVC